MQSFIGIANRSTVAALVSTCNETDRSRNEPSYWCWWCFRSTCYQHKSSHSDHKPQENWDTKIHLEIFTQLLQI